MVESITHVDSSPSLKFGSYTIHLSGQLLLLFFRGTWSDKCASDYVRDVSRFREEHKLTRFASIAIISDWKLGTPGALNTVTAVIRKGAETGMVGQFILSEGNNALSVHIARQHVAKAIPGAILGSELNDFLPALQQRQIEFDEARVRLILASDGRCD